MNIATNRWEHAAALLAQRERAAEFVRWLHTMERYSIAIGARALVEHVPDSQWRAWFDAGQDPESAVLAELAEVAD